MLGSSQKEESISNETGRPITASPAKAREDKPVVHKQDDKSTKAVTEDKGQSKANETEATNKDEPTSEGMGMFTKLALGAAMLGIGAAVYMKMKKD